MTTPKCDPNDYLHTSLSTREYFAAMAMQGLLSSGKYSEGIAIHPALGFLSNQAADALINALNENQQ